MTEQTGWPYGVPPQAPPPPPAPAEQAQAPAEQAEQAEPPADHGPPPEIPAGTPHWLADHLRYLHRVIGVGDA